MSQIQIDFGTQRGPIKPMHCVNNGPTCPTRMFSKSGNFESYKAARIPYARNHDAGFDSNYGGDHTVDINAIFRNFDADPYDPASYDFICTDHYTKTIMDAGTQVFYRLGNKIDHRIKKYDSVPPKDFHKWAVICEHIIRHYNEGWADGFHWNIVYWEIWNEPENGAECWDGPYESFLELFEIAAKHLKSCFPHLKIGGPAFATGGIDRKAEPFLRHMKERDVPLDFLSWHTYRPSTDQYEKRILNTRRILDECGYPNAESILNEWAYVINWHDKLEESKLAIIGIKGAAFVSAVMATGQRTPLDMLMYYDARPCSLNCLFDFYTSRPLKGYYPFPMFATLYDLGTSVDASADADDLYAVAATDGDRSALMLTYFTNDNEATERQVTLTLKNGGADRYSVKLLDDAHDCETVEPLTLTDGTATLTMSPNSVLLLESAE